MKKTNKLNAFDKLFKTVCEAEDMESLDDELLNDEPTDDFGGEDEFGGKEEMGGEDVTITLQAPPTSGHRVDFVFLEVWKELLGPSDTIYPWGSSQAIYIPSL